MKTITHNGVPCVEARVHMLATEDVTDILFIGDWNKLSFNNIVEPHELGKDEVYQHLFITANEKIKEGDWYLDTETNEVKKYTKDCI